MKKYFAVFLSYVLVISFLNAQENILRYDIYEKAIERTTPYDNKSGDVRMIAKFYDNYDRVHFVDGFNDGGKTWKVRFGVDNPQLWKYSVEFSDSDSIYNGSFTCSWNIGRVEPFQVSIQNPRWFKRIVHPFLIKGTRIDWDAIVKYDTIQLKKLRDYGFNTVFLDYPVTSAVNLMSGNLESVRALERSLLWIHENNMIAILPLFLFPQNKKPSDRDEWNYYIRNLFARFGAYQTISFYLPGNNNPDPISAEERKMILRAVAENNKYLSPLGTFDETPASGNDSDTQYRLCQTGSTDLTGNPDREIPRPYINIVTGNVNNDPEMLIRTMSEAFINGINCIADAGTFGGAVSEKEKGRFS